VRQITPRWGYLVTGSNPQALWLGEFGTCNTGRNCVRQQQISDNGYWFGFVTTYLQTNGVDWCYWPSTAPNRRAGAEPMVLAKPMVCS